MADLAAKSWKSDKMAISGDETGSHLSVAAELRDSGSNIQLLLLWATLICLSVMQEKMPAFRAYELAFYIIRKSSWAKNM